MTNFAALNKRRHKTWYIDDEEQEVANLSSHCSPVEEFKAFLLCIMLVSGQAEYPHSLLLWPVQSNVLFNAGSEFAF